jgi:hypothetical protein
MKFYRIEHAFNLKDRWYLRSPLTQSGVEVDPRLFTEGKEYRGEQNLEIPIRQGSHALDFTLGSFDMPVVVPSLAQLLQACCGNTIQIVSASVPELGKSVRIINALKILDAIDEQRSEITWWTEEDGRPAKVGTYAGIGNLVIKGQKIEGALIFRLKDWELPLIVNEELKDMLEKAQATGVVFQELDVYAICSRDDPHADGPRLSALDYDSDMASL